MAKENTQETQQGERKEAAEQRGVAQRDRTVRLPTLAMASPFTFMRRFIDDLDHLFGPSPFMLGADPIPFSAASRQAMWMPPLEVVERDGQLVIRADVPGLTKDQIQVVIEDGQLVISGERRQEHEEQKGGLYRSERSYGSFYRAVLLPDGVDPAQAHATFANGVLEIALPMSKRTRAQRVEVQEGTGTKPAAHAEAKSA